MAKNVSWQTKLLICLSVVITGLGVGWLVGLSVSPVISIVITSITGAVAAVITASSGLEEKSKWSVNPIPLALLVIGLSIGSGVGIRIRNLDWLGRNLTAEVAMWQAVGLTLDRGKIVQRLFDDQYPSNGQKGGISQSSNSILFAVPADECTTLRNQTGKKLQAELRSSTIKEFQKLPELIMDSNVLEQLVKEVLCADHG